MSMVEVLDVSTSRRHGGLADISFTVQPGERVAILGGPGAGKTTLLNLIAGRSEPEEGAVRVLGRAPRRLHRLVAYAAEESRHRPLVSIHQVVSQVLARRGVPVPERHSQAAETLALVGLEKCRDRPVRDMSRAQRACLTLATALAARPGLLLVDNLTAALPDAISEAFWGRVDERRAGDDLTVVHATTSTAEAEAADRVLLLDDGRPLAVATPQQLLESSPPDVLSVEAADPDAVRCTLRGIFDVEVVEGSDGLHFHAADGLAAAAYLLRHPNGGVRTIYLKRRTLWDVIEALRRGDGAMR